MIMGDQVKLTINHTNVQHERNFSFTRIQTPPTARGNYYLKTNAESPFALGNV